MTRAGPGRGAQGAAAASARPEAPGAASAGAVAGVRSLYLHIPFCERRCEYCDFVALAGRDREIEYANRLRAEIAGLAAGFAGVELDTVFVGGGTPGFMAPELLAGLLQEVRAGFALAAGCEVTLEANPSSTTRARAESWLGAGFNRVSLGVQSLEPEILRFLGRVHDADRAVAAVAEVRRAGFSHVSCDLIYAVPGLTDERWRATLERVIGLGPGHVSAYELTVEPGTPLHARVLRGRSPAVDPEAALRQHRIAVEVLQASGHRQYEVSNYALPGEECRHNLVYWRNGHYLAAGLGAHGHLPAALASRLGLPEPPDAAVAVRYWHGRSLAAYLASPAGEVPVEGWEPVGAAAREVERVMVGLRLAEGIAPPAGGEGRAAPLLAAGLLWSRDGRVGATARGQEVLDEVIRQLTG
ncbi:MAG: radical SAM family heme chaperone HemW [Candidatus Dormibacteria bacterium]